MNRKFQLSMLLIFLFSTGIYLHSNEMTNSLYYDYFRFLEVQGEAESPTLMYNSLSMNDWELDDQHLWSGGYGEASNLIDSDLWSLSLSPVELLFSGNTAYSRKELSDGGWWQGKGLNGFGTAGVTLESSWFSITLQPEIWFSQNLYFDILTAVTDSDFGYFANSSIDWVQRFGDDAFYDFGWGQSDIHLNWKNLVLGVSTENFVWGPSLINSLMFSDNAEGFPHIYYGLEKTNTTAGNFELLAMRGILSESDYYDDDEDNNNTFVHGITGAWEPVWIPGLSFGLKWALLSNWEVWEQSWQLQAFGYDFTNDYFGGDEFDQKGSVTINWKLPESNFEWYFEFFREDYSPSLRFILLAPGHSAGYTLGFQKVFPLSEGRGISLITEYNELIQSRDYEIDLGVSTGSMYYSHSIVRHGFTNTGQMLGAGIGPGSDMETLKLNYYDSWGQAGLTFQRICWNKMYLYGDASTKSSSEGADNLRLNTEVSLGLNGMWLINNNFNLQGEMLASYNMNFNYIKENDVFNFYAKLGLQYRL